MKTLSEIKNPRKLLEIEKEIQRREKRKKEERQRRFREFVENLKKKGMSGKEYREAIAKWNRQNPWTN